LSGVLAILKQAYLFSEDDSLLQEIDKCSSMIIKDYDEKLAFGFKTEPPSNDENDNKTIDNPGLNTGSAGIILSLLHSISDKEFIWPSIFLLK